MNLKQELIDLLIDYKTGMEEEILPNISLDVQMYIYRNLYKDLNDEFHLTLYSILNHELQKKPLS